MVNPSKRVLVHAKAMGPFCNNLSASLLSVSSTPIALFANVMDELAIIEADLKYLAHDPRAARRFKQATSGQPDQVRFVSLLNLLKIERLSSCITV